MVHEGDTYFERCYAADFEARVTPEQREACWTAWVAHYTRLQPAHRVDYAMRRVESLQNGEPTPSLPDLPNAIEGNAVVVLPDVDAEVGYRNTELLSALLAVDAGPVPNGCLAFCDDYESRCVARCPHGSLECREVCAAERAICLNACH